MKIVARTASLVLAAAAFCAPEVARADQAGYLYSYGIYDQRYNDAVSALDAYKPLGAPGAAVRPYAALYGTRDSRTSSGALPLIYGDNYVLGSVGVQYTRPYGLRLYTQIGLSAPLGTAPATRSGLDVRAGVQDYREWTAARDVRNYGNFYGSLFYLSRYDDVIAYGQIEQGHRFGSVRNPIEVYGRATLTLDTHNFYYDNVAEFAGGVRLHPFGVRGPSVALEEAIGTYVHGARPLETPATFADFRPTIAFGMSI